MKVLKLILKLFTLLLVLGTLLTLLLTLLTGGTQTSILKKFYWLETECSGFSGSPVSSTCRWTSYGLCGVSSGSNTNCTHAAAAYPFSPSRNFASDNGLPQKFIDNANYYYYTSRIGWGFTLVGAAFVFFSWFPYFVMLGTENVALKSAFWAFWGLAILFTVPGISLLTASYVKGRNIFRDSGLHTSIGTKSMAVAWTSVFLLFFTIPFLAFSTKDWETLAGRTIYRKSYDTESGQHKKRAGLFGFGKKQHTHDYDEDDTVVGTGGAANYLSFTPIKKEGAGAGAADPPATAVVATSNTEPVLTSP